MQGEVVDVLKVQKKDEECLNNGTIMWKGTSGERGIQPESYAAGVDSVEAG